MLNLKHLRGLHLRDAPQRAGHLLLQPCFDVCRGVLAGLGRVLLTGPIQPVAGLNDVGASLKRLVAEFAHPFLLARPLAVLFDHRLTQAFAGFYISVSFPPPAVCANAREHRHDPRLESFFASIRNRIFFGTLLVPKRQCCFNSSVAGGHEWPSRPEAEGTLGHGLVQDLRVL